MKSEELLYNWNCDPAPGGTFFVLDETLRDGIQSPSVTNPCLEGPHPPDRSSSGGRYCSQDGLSPGGLRLSSVPASELGLQQRIEVGYYSGRANLLAWLSRHDIEPSESRVLAVLELAKKCRATLTEDELLACLSQTD